MAKEDKTQYDSLRATDVIEFFYLFKVYAKNVEIKKQANTTKK